MPLGVDMVRRLITVRLYQWCVFISPRFVSSDNQIYLNYDKNGITDFPMIELCEIFHKNTVVDKLTELLI